VKTRTIWKFELRTIDEQSVSITDDAKILCVQAQNGQPCLWAEVGEGSPRKLVKIRTFGIGHMITGDPGDYIGTYQLCNGLLIFHVYASTTDESEG